MRKSLRAIVVVIALVAAGAAGLELYARYPPAFAVPDPVVAPGTRVLVLLLHGSNGREEPTLIALERRFAQLAAETPDVSVLRYIWSPFSDTRLRARVNGGMVGSALGRNLAQRTDIEVLHLVGHSAGAYPVQALCEALRASSARPPRIVSTFLDPIGFDGALNPNWGAGNLGRCADYAEAYINTDDPVPATNAPLAQAWTVDVTATRPTPASDGHRWPAQYYLDHLTQADITGSAYSHDERPRGSLDVR
ncbi:MAG: hypothetical protein FJ197_04695 [Gammaproteobacteria bacterium]|nr:hypothetical protein [Gammaproteobacteria bacterium]